MQYILYALLAWFLYKLIFGFIIPVYRASRQVRKQFQQMQERMQQQQQPSARPQRPVSRSSKISSDDYIDFEEVKE